MSASAAAAGAAAAVVTSAASAAPADSEAAIAAPVADTQLMAAMAAGQQQHGATAAAETSSNLHASVKWKTHSYEVVLPQSATVGFLKMQIGLLTDVRPHRQKLMLTGAKVTKLQDDMQLTALGLKDAQKFKCMLIGNPEEQLILDDDAKAAALEPVDDLDYEFRPADLRALRDDPVVRAKVEKMYLAMKDTITVINPIRAGKKLLVLDLDYTLYDMHGDQEGDWKILRRPFTHRFLTRCYEQYELVIWSQTSWRWLEMKLTELGILTHPSYKICFVLDKTSMFRVSGKDSKGETRKHAVKCLELIWRRFPQWNATNTIHIDDLGRNFALNPQSGLKIIPYKNSHQTRATDRELHHLAPYLMHIATLPDFTKLDHDKWKSVVPAPPKDGAAAAAAAASGIDKNS